MAVAYHRAPGVVVGTRKSDLNYLRPRALRSVNEDEGARFEVPPDKTPFPVTVPLPAIQRPLTAVGQLDERRRK